MFYDIFVMTVKIGIMLRISLTLLCDRQLSQVLQV